MLKLWKKFLAILAASVPQSTAGQISAVAFVCLLLMWILVWILRLYGPFQIPHREVITWVHWFLEILLLFAIPVLLYLGLKIWWRKLEGQFPDIDRAWIAGIDALKDIGVSLTDKPIFLIIGSPDTVIGRNLMSATQVTMRVEGIPRTDGVQSPLQWYVSENAIYLFCNGVSSLSVLQKRMDLFGKATLDTPIALNNINVNVPTNIPSSKSTQPSGPQQPPVPPPPSAKLPHTSISQPTPTNDKPPKTTDAAGPVSSGPVSNGPIGTISADMLQRRSIEPRTNSSNPLLVPKPTAPALSEPAAIIENQLKNTQTANQPTPTVSIANLSTIRVSDKIQSRTKELPKIQPVEAQTEPAAAPAPNRITLTENPKKPKKLALPEHLDASENCQRLAYLCRILKKSRKGHCGINGMLALIPFQLTHLGSSKLAAISQAAYDDLSTIQETLRLKFPVTALLLGLEQERGFKELVRRLPQEFLSRRLGGKFDIRSIPNADQLNQYSDVLCDIFEDWVQDLFREQDTLPQQRGNRRLYELVCKVRYQLKPRLRLVLGDVFGYSEAEDIPMPPEKAPFFSGCYFAACGENKEQNAFVRGVLVDKLIAEQSSVEWTTPALVENRINRSIAWTGWFLSACFFLLISLWIIWNL